MTPLRVGIVGYEQANALDIVGPAEAFASALRMNKGVPERCYEVSILGLTKRPFTTESGIVFQPAATIEQRPKLDTLIIPGGCGLREPEINRRMTRWLSDAAPGVRRVASVCTGIYGLAATGLLDGRRATTHWRFAADVARRFPDAAARAERAVHQGREVLHLRRRDGGHRSRARHDRGGLRIEDRARPPRARWSFT